ncbi:putative ribulose bisphosphate carboxylase-like protein [Symbiodinium microadriaticum]|uniref:Putative ribulose bisphosphate carboxylase-like protein n=1 Tax=Symbiodinium microadriaticum TaxID=2951 RepID=A0A1Q9CFJ6_SYMMI|nr:putative ribulose bisphosphate carboxylase-like protein [Symbiodinium microadriaticum]
MLWRCIDTSPATHPPPPSPPSSLSLVAPLPPATATGTIIIIIIIIIIITISADQHQHHHGPWVPGIIMVLAILLTIIIVIIIILILKTHLMIITIVLAQTRRLPQPRIVGERWALAQGRLEFLDVFQSDQGELQLLVPMKMAILGQEDAEAIKAVVQEIALTEMEALRALATQDQAYIVKCFDVLELHGYVHADIKPENLLITGTGERFELLTWDAATELVLPLRQNRMRFSEAQQHFLTAIEEKVADIIDIDLDLSQYLIFKRCSQKGKEEQRRIYLYVALAVLALLEGTSPAWQLEQRGAGAGAGGGRGGGGGGGGGGAVGCGAGGSSTKKKAMKKKKKKEEDGSSGREVVEDGEIDEGRRLPQSAGAGTWDSESVAKDPEGPLGIDQQNQYEVLQSPQELPAEKAEVDFASAETEDEDGEVSDKEAIRRACPTGEGGNVNEALAGRLVLSLRATEDISAEPSPDFSQAWNWTAWSEEEEDKEVAGHSDGNWSSRKPAFPCPGIDTGAQMLELEVESYNRSRLVMEPVVLPISGLVRKPAEHPTRQDLQLLAFKLPREKLHLVITPVFVRLVMSLGSERPGAATGGCLLPGFPQGPEKPGDGGADCLRLRQAVSLPQTALAAAPASSLPLGYRFVAKTYATFQDSDFYCLVCHTTSVVIGRRLPTRQSPLCAVHQADAQGIDMSKQWRRGLFRKWVSGFPQDRRQRVPFVMISGAGPHSELELECLEGLGAAFSVPLEVVLSWMAGCATFGAALDAAGGCGGAIVDEAAGQILYLGIGHHRGHGLARDLVRAAEAALSGFGHTVFTIVPLQHVPKDGQARAFWFAQGYLGEADGGTTSAMRKAISDKGRLVGGTTESFAALRRDGSVVTWGGHPGPELKNIFSIWDDGTVIVWSCGEEGRVGLEHPALDVRADDFAFYITDVYGEEADSMAMGKEHRAKEQQASRMYTCCGPAVQGHRAQETRVEGWSEEDETEEDESESEEAEEEETEEEDEMEEVPPKEVESTEKDTADEEADREDKVVIIPGGMNALHLPAFFETIGRANLTSDGPFGISGRQAEEAWTAWRSGQYGSISLSDGVIEFAKTHDEMKRLFLTFRRDADRIYPGWREKLGYKASALGSRLFARALQDVTTDRKAQPARGGGCSSWNQVETRAAAVAAQLRRTVMLKNIPCRKTQEEVMLAIDQQGFGARFDFFYLPWDSKFRANRGYAFVNFIVPEDAAKFQSKMTGYRFQNTGSAKVCSVARAHVQGALNNLNALKGTKVMRWFSHDDAASGGMTIAGTTTGIRNAISAVTAAKDTRSEQRSEPGEFCQTHSVDRNETGGATLGARPWCRCAAKAGCIEQALLPESVEKLVVLSLGLSEGSVKGSSHRFVQA